MLKKKIGLEVIERGWSGHYGIGYYKIPSTLIIPENCERIGPYTFSCSKLRKVIIPESVDWIGLAAFYGCWWLEEVVIPGSVDWICGSAFEDCFRATVTLEKPKREFKYIAGDTFEGCKDVKEETRS